jgi:hypothetical protein
MKFKIENLKFRLDDLLGDGETGELLESIGFAFRALSE